MSLVTLGEFVLFADDTNIFVTGKDEKSAYRKANIVLEEVHEYINICIATSSI